MQGVKRDDIEGPSVGEIPLKELAFEAPRPVHVVGADALSFTEAVNRYLRHVKVLHTEGAAPEAVRYAEQILDSLGEDVRLFQESLRAQFVGGTYTRSDLQTDLLALDSYVDSVLCDFTYADYFLWSFLGIDEGGTKEDGLEDGMVGYVPSRVQAIQNFLTATDIGADDIVVDLGSGPGPVAQYVGLFSRAKRVEAVDVVDDHISLGSATVQRIGLDNVEFLKQDVRAYDFSRGTVFFLYHHFFGDILEEVVDRLAEEAKNRDIRVFTYRACGREFEKNDAFSRIDYFQNTDEDEPRLLRSARYADSVVIDPSFRHI